MRNSVRNAGPRPRLRNLNNEDMAISPELLEILRCPQCKSKVQIDEAETRLKCVNDECRLVYPIRDEIPVMLVDEATRE